MAQVQGFSFDHTNKQEIFRHLKGLQSKGYLPLAGDRLESIHRLHNYYNETTRSRRTHGRTQENGSQTSGDSSDSRYLKAREGGPGGALEDYIHHEADLKGFGNISSDKVYDVKASVKLEDIEDLELDEHLDGHVAALDPHELQHPSATNPMPDGSHFTPLNNPRPTANPSRSERMSEAHDSTGYPGGPHHLHQPQSLPQRVSREFAPMPPYGPSSPNSAHLYFPHQYTSNGPDSVPENGLNIQADQPPLSETMYSPPQQNGGWYGPSRHDYYPPFGNFPAGLDTSLNAAGDIGAFQTGELYGYPPHYYHQG